MELGDNPCVSEGAAVTIAWSAHDEKVYDMDVYEIFRRNQKKKGLNFLCHDQRLAILERAGYSDDEIAKATLQVEKIRRQREMSHRLGPWNRVENLGRSVQRLFRRQQQQLQMQQHRVL